MLQYMFIISGAVIGSVICHYIIKWLDSIQERLAQIKKRPAATGRFFDA